MSFKNPYVLLAMALSLGTMGQLLFKTGLNKMGGQIELSPQIIRIFFTPYIAAGLLCYVLSTFGWLSALSKLPLSVAYPTISATYVLIFILSIFFLNEQYTHMKLLGNIFIITGIILINVIK